MEGKGVDAPLPLEASLHLKKASDHNVPQAHHCLALLYEYGRGVAQDFNKAAELYKRAAEENQLESMYNLGLMYAYGRGVPQDFTLARSYFEKAAALDHAGSIFYIGVFKFQGYGCKVNYEQALNWFQRALSLGDDRIYEQAKAAMDEVKTLIEKAVERNEQMVNSYHQRNEFPL
jgi:TPR repeat protein